ncbi:RHS repeat domain-containing protein [Nonomuraea sp. NPDC052265]|uniref:RHS repeat domain-containing protein n=1 Tax=Nonomuraea sp. NPDC052265 TaxID=3364374 RepID=UPI0037CA772A
MSAYVADCPESAGHLNYGYDKASRLTSMSFNASGARRSYTYDAMNRLTKDQLTTSSGGAIASIEYGYDLDDNLTSKTTAGTAGSGVNTYTYDWSDRLTSWTTPDGTKTDYAWDASGNRVKAGDKTYTYDERNRLTSGDGHTYSYTPRGTLAEDSAGIVRLTKFDAFDRLVRDDTVTYDYDALDRVEIRTANGKSSRFTYDGLTNNLTCVTDANNVITAAFGRDAFGRTLGISDGTGPILAFSDLRGDLIGTFTANGTALADSVAYDPFGEVITRTGATHALGYQSGYTDPDSGKVNVENYTDCRKDRNGRGVCRDGAVVYASCVAGGYGKDKCADGGDLYESCRTANRSNRGWAREMCANQELIHRECRTRNNKDTCEYEAESYEDCRTAGKRGHDGCKEYAEYYLTCRNANKRDDWFCKGVQDSVRPCVVDARNDMGKCRDVPKLYEACAKKYGERGCYSEDDHGAKGNTCKKAKNLTDALTYSCDIYLSHQQVNLLNVALGLTGTVAGFCMAVPVLLVACGVLGAAVGIALTAINLADSKERGVIITYSSITGNESVTVASQ